MNYSHIGRECIDTLIKSGTNHYGRVDSPIWVLTLDVNSLETVRRFNDCLESIYHWRMSQGETNYSSMVPFGFGHRAIRVSQRPAGCSNLYVDQPMLRAAVLIDALHSTNYAKPVNDYIRYYLKHFINSQTGLIEWGVHISYNVFEERFESADGHHHEIEGILPNWPILYESAPQIIRNYLERFWEWHTDPQSGVVGRHPDHGDGCSFAMAAGEMVLACAFRHTLESEGPWLNRALIVARSHYASRNPTSNLFPNRLPSLGYELAPNRFDQNTGDTSIPGLWCSRVLMAGVLAECDELKDMALTMLHAWAKYGWDDRTNKPWAMLQTDGTPVDAPRVQLQTYDRQAPKGHWDYWKNYVYGFEYPFATLVTYAMAGQLLNDDLLTTHATRLADCYIEKLPANEGRGTFAANYGQLISFLLYLERFTGDERHRHSAKKVVDEAVDKLWSGKLFRGFPGKNTYEAIDGVGYLVQALIEFDADPQQLLILQQKNPFLWNI